MIQVVINFLHFKFLKKIHQTVKVLINAKTESEAVFKMIKAINKNNLNQIKLKIGKNLNESN